MGSKINKVKKAEYDREYRKKNAAKIKEYAKSRTKLALGIPYKFKERNISKGIDWNDREQVNRYNREYFAERKKEPEYRSRLNRYAQKSRDKNYDKIKECNKRYGKKRYISSRNLCIELYTHGTNKCVKCGGLVQELHHTNPEHGAWDKKNIFGAARYKHYIDMYTVIPNYITPVCKDCHIKIHKELDSNSNNGGI